MANRKLTLAGGFHNSPEITISLPESIYRRVITGELDLCEHHVLSVSQRKKLDRHFCGIKGCTCGGVQRASIV